MRGRALRETALFAAGAFVYFSILQFLGPYLADGDAYFHIKIAGEILRHGFVRSLPSMAYSIHSEHYVDYHFLYHYALVPFAALAGDPIRAAKWATAFFSASSVFALSLLLWRMRVRTRWFWILFYCLSSPVFTGRLMFGRGSTLFLALLFLFLFFYAGPAGRSNRRYLYAAVLAASSVWTYPGFPVLAAFTVLYGAASWRSAASLRIAHFLPLMGILGAVIVHPGMPWQFYGFWLEYAVHWFRPDDVEKIAEWLPPGASLLQVGLWIPMLVFVPVVLLRPTQNPFLRSLMVLSFLLAFSLAASLKPFEYVIPVICVYAAGAVKGWHLPRFKEIAAASLLAAMVFWSLPQTYLRMIAQFALQFPTEDFDAADWVKANTKPGELVLLPWDAYPTFFFRNDSNRYLYGLNPIYSYGYDKTRYAEIRHFFQGDWNEKTRPHNQWGARFAVLEPRYHGAAMQRLLASGSILVHKNEKFVIIRL